MNTKELLQVEFRYETGKGENEKYHTKTVTIGIYDTLDEAIIEGNKLLEKLSKRFEVRHDDKFIKNHLFGFPKRLVTNCCYHTKRIQYFAQIKKLEFNDVEEVVSDIFNQKSQNK